MAPATRKERCRRRSIKPGKMHCCSCRTCRIVIRNQIEEQRNSGGENQPQNVSVVTLEKVKGSLLADMTLMMVLDGVTKEWTLRHVQLQLGKHFLVCRLLRLLPKKQAAG